MSTTNARWFVAVVVFFTGFCVSIAGSRPASAMQPQTGDVYAPLGCTVGVDCDVVGTSSLVRTEAGVAMTLRTTELDPGAAYTVWWVVFNNPAACDDGCNAPDLGNPAVLGTVLYAAGHVIGPTGKGNFAAHLAVGDTSGDSFPVEFPGDLVGLIAPLEAEIHLVVRTHGPPIPGMVAEQISTFNGGGCHDPGDDTDACEDQQFAVHLP